MERENGKQSGRDQGIVNKMDRTVWAATAGLKGRARKKLIVQEKHPQRAAYEVGTNNVNKPCLGVHPRLRNGDPGEGRNSHFGRYTVVDHEIEPLRFDKRKKNEEKHRKKVGLENFRKGNNSQKSGKNTTNGGRACGVAGGGQGTTKGAGSGKLNKGTRVCVAGRLGSQ